LSPKLARFRRACLAVLLIVVALAVAACDVESTASDSASAPVRDEHPNRTWVVLVDLSGSTAEDRADYLKLYKAMLTRVERGDTVLMYDIAKNSIVNAKPLLELSVNDAEIERQDIDSDETYAAKLKQWNDQHPVEPELAPAQEPELLTTIETADSGGSDIIGSIRLAQRVFALEDAEPRLVVFSDMLLNGEYDLGNEESAKQGVAWLEAHPEVLSDLDQAKVLVAGAGDAKLSPEHYDYVKAFWMKYFNDSNAELDENFFGRQLPEVVLEQF